MPSGPTHLHARFGSDAKAIELLEAAGYRMDAGFVFHPPCEKHGMSADEMDAVDYLCLEWDYGYSPEPIAEGTTE